MNKFIFAAVALALVIFFKNVGFFLGKPTLTGEEKITKLLASKELHRSLKKIVIHQSGAAVKLADEKDPRTPLEKSIEKFREHLDPHDRRRYLHRIQYDLYAEKERLVQLKESHPDYDLKALEDSIRQKEIELDELNALNVNDETEKREVANE